MKIPEKITPPKYSSSAYEVIQLNSNYWGYIKGWNECLDEIKKLNKPKKNIPCEHKRIREHQDHREHFRKCIKCGYAEDYPYQKLKYRKVSLYANT